MGLGKGEEMSWNPTSTALREQYKKNGYVKCSFENDITNPNWNELSFRKLFNDGIEYYTSWLKMASKEIFLQELFLDDVADFIEYLEIKPIIIISQPVLHVMSPSLRIPDGYYGTESHQDWPSTQGSLDCVTVWIALTDATVGNFPLEVIPGSHKRGLLEGNVNGSVLEIEADDKEFVPIECKAGDAIFFSGFIVHRTGKGNGFRVAVSQRFDNASEPTFIERGYPCAQKRVIDRTINWKPTVQQVNEVFK